MKKEFETKVVKVDKDGSRHCRRHRLCTRCGGSGVDPVDEKWAERPQEGKGREK